tara:strand:- start:1399 stop:1587 length:189 start_codon:yes stop_codon:yes gene_type:complete
MVRLGGGTLSQGNSNLSESTQDRSNVSGIISGMSFVLRFDITDRIEFLGSSTDWANSTHPKK